MMVMMVMMVMVMMVMVMMVVLKKIWIVEAGGPWALMAHGVHSSNADQTPEKSPVQYKGIHSPSQAMLRTVLFNRWRKAQQRHCSLLSSSGPWEKRCFQQPEIFNSEHIPSPSHDTTHIT